MEVPDADPNAPDAGAAGEAELLRSDPFGDGTEVAFVADFANRIYLGPSKDGTQFFRMVYDGSATTRVNMSFPGDGDNLNGSSPPYGGIG
jgi:hypothetical protein